MTPPWTPAGLDALMPVDMARRAEDVGVAKASMDAARLFVLAVLAGAFIAFGAVFATVALAGAAGAPGGPVRVTAGVVFSVGLILVVVGGAELFTGNNLIVMAWAGGRVTSPVLAVNWLITYAGNLVGATGIAALVYAGGSHDMGGGAFGRTALDIAAAKIALSPTRAVALGILCNILVCLAVWLSMSARTTTDRILAVVPPVSAFVAAGFEHSIANMYFVPYALLVAGLDPGFVETQGLAAQASTLGWAIFAWRNLLPVTVGNVVGGTLAVGAVYWFVYLRPRSPG